MNKLISKALLSQRQLISKLVLPSRTYMTQITTPRLLTQMPVRFFSEEDKKKKSAPKGFEKFMKQVKKESGVKESESDK